MSWWDRAINWFSGLITPKPVIRLPHVVLPPSVGAMETSYKELLGKRDAFLELRDKVKRGVEYRPATSGGEILGVDIDPDTGDLLVTGRYKRSEEVAQRTHRITITEETDEGPTS